MVLCAVVATSSTTGRCTPRAFSIVHFTHILHFHRRFASSRRFGRFCRLRLGLFRERQCRTTRGTAAVHDRRWRILLFASRLLPLAHRHRGDAHARVVGAVVW